MAMIEVEHLQKNFVKTVKEPGLKGALRSFIHPEKQTFEAVKDLTFEVPKGQILGFIGANGAGKSTTIKMLTGILKPTSGYCLIKLQDHKLRKNRMDESEMICPCDFYI